MSDIVLPKDGESVVYHRSFEDLIEGPCPNMGLCLDWEQSRRHLAVAEVLRRLPDTAWEALKEAEQTFSWFIPERDMHGACWPFPVTHEEVRDSAPGRKSIVLRYSCVLYLSPLLEDRSWEFIVGVVAHELAHIVLDHHLFTRNPDEYEAQEREANELLEAWGFGPEWRHHQRWMRRRVRERERQLEVLKAELPVGR